MVLPSHSFFLFWQASRLFQMKDKSPEACQSAKNAIRPPPKIIADGARIHDVFILAHQFWQCSCAWGQKLSMRLHRANFYPLFYPSNSCISRHDACELIPFFPSHLIIHPPPLSKHCISTPMPAPPTSYRLSQCADRWAIVGDWGDLSILLRCRAR